MNGFEWCYKELMEAEGQLNAFIDRFTPEVAELTRQLLAKMKARVPGASIMVYDNYNALAIGFGIGEHVRGGNANGH